MKFPFGHGARFLLVLIFPQIAMWFPNWLTQGDRLNRSVDVPALESVEKRPALEAGDR